ncbi:hypothetical protein [Saccharothrix sp. HUAS TT1]|uniref:hypothetical protein n=1 Tax=unclassified Saccharothrix TaxID=2593673 RepID=UPI00345C3314
MFAGAATYLVNRDQADDLARKGPGYLEMFRGLDPAVARRLADVSGARWLAVLDRLVAEGARTVVPGPGDVGGARLLTEACDHLRLLRDETWSRSAAGMAEEAIAAEVAAPVVERRPEWSGREWVDKGIGCLCAELPHPGRDDDHLFTAG